MSHNGLGFKTLVKSAKKSFSGLFEQAQASTPAARQPNNRTTAQTEASENVVLGRARSLTESAPLLANAAQPGGSSQNEPTEMAHRRSVASSVYSTNTAGEVNAHVIAARAEALAKLTSGESEEPEESEDGDWIPDWVKLARPRYADDYVDMEGSTLAEGEPEAEADDDARSMSSQDSQETIRPARPVTWHFRGPSIGQAVRFLQPNGARSRSRGGEEASAPVPGGLRRSRAVTLLNRPELPALLPAPAPPAVETVDAPRKNLRRRAMSSISGIFRAKEEEQKEALWTPGTPWAPEIPQTEAGELSRPVPIRLAELAGRTYDQIERRMMIRGWMAMSQSAKKDPEAEEDDETERSRQDSGPGGYVPGEGAFYQRRDGGRVHLEHQFDPRELNNLRNTDFSH